MSGKTLARIGAVAFVAVALTATAVELGRKGEVRGEASVAAPAAVPADPLFAVLVRCQRLGEGGPRDPACLDAWAENRRRFLGVDRRAGSR